MKRALPPGLVARRLVELELQDTGEEVAGVGHVRGDVILGPGIETVGPARHGRRDALVLQLHVDPMLAVVGGLDLAAEHVPAIAVDQQAERQERDLVHRLAQQQAKVLVGTGHRRAIEQADLDRPA